jgi:hypothetical protein
MGSAWARGGKGNDAAVVGRVSIAGPGPEPLGRSSRRVRCAGRALSPRHRAHRAPSEAPARTGPHTAAPEEWASLGAWPEMRRADAGAGTAADGASSR